MLGEHRSRVTQQQGGFDVQLEGHTQSTRLRLAIDHRDRFSDRDDPCLPVLPLAALIKFPLLMLPTIWLARYASFAMPLFLVLAAYRIWWSRGAVPMTGAGVAVAAAEAPDLWRPRRAALVGAAIALAVLLWSLHANSQMNFLLILISLAAWLLPAFVPTFLLYTALVATVMRLIARRDAIAAAALVAALIPFGFWAMSLSTVLQAKAQERAAVAAIPKVALPANIGAVVIEGEDWSSMNCARGRVLSAAFDFGDVLTHGQSKSPYLRFTRATANSPVGRGSPADSAPAEYILIRFPRRPAFFQDRVSRGYCVTSGRNLRSRPRQDTACRGDLHRAQPAAGVPADADRLRLVPWR